MVTAIIFVYKMSVKAAKIDVPLNAPLINCETRKQFTNGYTDGLLKRILPRKNGTFLIEFYPIDGEQGENKPKPELQSFIVHKSMVQFHARGESSARRDKILILPRSPTDLPEKMRETDYGKWMTAQGQLAWLQKTFGPSIPAGDEAIANAMLEFARGNISAAQFAQLKEMFSEMRNLNNAQKPTEPEKEKKSA